MQNAYLDHLGIFSLILLGVILMFLIVGRFVPGYQIIRRIAISREQEDSSFIPLWFRMIFIPFFASTIPTALSSLYVLLHPESLDIFLYLLDIMILYMASVFFLSMIGYISRENLPYYKRNEDEG